MKETGLRLGRGGGVLNYPPPPPLEHWRREDVSSKAVGWCLQVRSFGAGGGRGRRGTGWYLGGALSQPFPAHHCNTVSSAVTSRPQEAGNEAAFTVVISALSSGDGSERNKEGGHCPLVYEKALPTST